MLEIIKVEIVPTAKKIGSLQVRYYDLLLECEIVFHSKPGEQKLWIRMPEIWFTKEKKMQFAKWISPEASANFQNSIIKLLKEEHSLGLAEAQHHHAEYANTRKQAKNPRQQ